jgi:hypothetical protein
LARELRPVAGAHAADLGHRHARRPRRGLERLKLRLRYRQHDLVVIAAGE